MARAEAGARTTFSGPLDGPHLQAQAGTNMGSVQWETLTKISTWKKRPSTLWTQWSMGPPADMSSGPRSPGPWLDIRGALGQ